MCVVYKKKDRETNELALWSSRKEDISFAGQEMDLDLERLES